MQKKVLLIFLITNSVLFSQYNEQKGHLWVKSSYGIVDTANYMNFSVGGEWILKKWNRRFGLNYNFDLVFRNDRIFQAHSSAGLIVGPPMIGLGILSWLASSDTDGDGEKDANFGSLGIIGGILLLVLPEGVSYHIPLKYNWDIAPYANVLGVDYMKNHNSNLSYFRYAATFGTKVTYWKESKYTISSFVETRKVAGMGWSLGGGLGIGYTIGRKEAEGSPD